jgi:hypothetical protein
LDKFEKYIRVCKVHFKAQPLLKFLYSRFSDSNFLPAWHRRCSNLRSRYSLHESFDIALLYTTIT